jgi:PmbA protein
MQNTISPHLLTQLDDLIRKAKAAGADSADGVITESMGLSTSVRNGEVTDMERSESLEMGLRVLVGTRQASLSSQVVDPAQFAELAERAVAQARMAPEDPYAGLADPKDFARGIADLDVFDANEAAPEKLVERAKELDALARAEKRLSHIEDASASWGMGGFAFVTSNGFSGGYRTTSHGHSLVVVAGEGTAMVRDYDYGSSLHANDLRPVKEVARTAITRTLSRLNARKMGTGKIPVVFAPRIATRILRDFLGAISGSAVARKATFLADALGTQVFAPGVTITDDPHVKRGLRSRPFDGEGLPTQKRNLVEDGRLTTWLLNLSAARQLGLQSTGHAVRGTAGSPGISPSNIVLEGGKLPPEALIADIKEGFYVTETMGFGVNTLTGDYSQGAAGFWIENGKIAHPVHEMTIAGELGAMLKNLTPANDLERRYGIDSPTLRVEGMTVAGN